MGEQLKSLAAQARCQVRPLSSQHWGAQPLNLALEGRGGAESKLAKLSWNVTTGLN